jgi:hypothetical protein
LHSEKRETPKWGLFLQLFHLHAIRRTDNQLIRMHIHHDAGGDPYRADLSTDGVCKILQSCQSFSLQAKPFAA